MFKRTFFLNGSYRNISSIISRKSNYTEQRQYFSTKSSSSQEHQKSKSNSSDTNNPKDTSAPNPPEKDSKNKRFFTFATGGLAGLSVSVGVLFVEVLRDKFKEKVKKNFGETMDGWLDALSLLIDAERAREDHGLIMIKWLFNKGEQEQANSYKNTDNEIVMLVNKGGKRLHSDLIWKTLAERAKNGVAIKILMIDPDSVDLLYPDRETCRREAVETIKLVQIFNASLTQVKNSSLPIPKSIEIRLLKRLPHLAIDLLDGDIEKAYKTSKKTKLIVMPKTDDTKPDDMMVYYFKDIGHKIGNRRKIDTEMIVKDEAPYFVFRNFLSHAWVDNLSNLPKDYREYQTTHPKVPCLQLKN